MSFAFVSALDVAAYAGCRLLTVDAYPAAIAFYERLGFVTNRAKEYQTKDAPEYAPRRLRSDVAELGRTLNVLQCSASRGSRDLGPRTETSSCLPSVPWK